MEWHNWSGSVRFTPSVIEKPRHDGELSGIICRAAEQKRKVRPTGSGYSCAPLNETKDVLVSMEHFKGLVSVDTRRCEATFRAGTTLHEAADALKAVGLALPFIGHMGGQTLAGAVSTGTHGSGWRILSDALIGVRLVNADGRIMDYTVRKAPVLFRAARVALGTLGIFTEIKLKVRALFPVERREFCAPFEVFIRDLEAFHRGNLAVDFYWYPRGDESKLCLTNFPGEGIREIDGAKCVSEEKGWSADVFTRADEQRYVEMEYALPLDAAYACFLAVRRRILDKHRSAIAWRLLYRVIPADEAFLSPAYGRPTVTISVYQNAGEPHQPYFNDIETIFRAYGGRPHWGKIHRLTAEELWLLYPMWSQFRDIRRQLDPENRFLSAYLSKVLEG